MSVTGTDWGGQKGSMSVLLGWPGCSSWLNVDVEAGWWHPGLRCLWGTGQYPLHSSPGWGSYDSNETTSKTSSREAWPVAFHSHIKSGQEKPLWFLCALHAGAAQGMDAVSGKSCTHQGSCHARLGLPLLPLKIREQSPWFSDFSAPEHQGNLVFPFNSQTRQ